MQKRILALSASALLAAGASFAETAQLHLFTWMDYVDPELVKQFEEENDCKVVIDIFDSNEAMLAKLQAGATGYDLPATWRSWTIPASPTSPTSIRPT